MAACARRPNLQTGDARRHSLHRSVGLHLEGGEFVMMKYFRPVNLSVFSPVSACLPSSCACSTALATPLACSMQNAVTRQIIFVAGTGIVWVAVAFGAIMSIAFASAGIAIFFHCPPTSCSIDCKAT